MKSMLIALTCLAVARASLTDADRAILLNELADIYDLIPLERITATMIRYALTDREVGPGLLCTMSLEFQRMAGALHNSTELKNLIEFLETSNLGMFQHSVSQRGYSIVKTLEILSTSQQPGTGGFAGLVNELRSIIPFQKIEALRRRKAETVPAVATYYALLRSHEFSRLIQDFRSSQEYRDLATTCQKKGFDLNAIVHIVCMTHGLESC